MSVITMVASQPASWLAISWLARSFRGGSLAATSSLAATGKAADRELVREIVVIVPFSARSRASSSLPILSSRFV